MRTTESRAAAMIARRRTRTSPRGRTEGAFAEELAVVLAM
jgi:hypothetical protein